MKIIIAGGREFDNYPMLHGVCHDLFIRAGNWVYTQSGVEIVSGGAKGADKLGEQFAKDWTAPVKVFPADWDTYGKSAGHRRNAEMADYADILVAFWDGESKGTRSMVNIALNAGLEVHVYRY